MKTKNVNPYWILKKNVACPAYTPFIKYTFNKLQSVFFSAKIQQTGYMLQFEWDDYYSILEFYFSCILLS